jgi:hypothetical protein
MIVTDAAKNVGEIGERLDGTELDTSKNLANSSAF